ncbi:MAG TPA: SDR family oxidoreductase [Chitinophagales bacterium]|nr:SDR family oxidoreductase [Chitinophagales bacterium]
MNKTVVITGATKGIGRALAFEFAAQKFDLAVCARSKSDLGNLRNEISLLYPGVNIMAQPCDVSKKDELQKFAEKINSQWQYIDVLINNAGIFLPGQVFNEKEGTLETLMETNLYSAYYLTRHLLPMMMERKSGHLFNMCSVASLQAYPNGGSYSISKFALLGLSKALREELKPYNIKVTAVLPGATLTNSWSGTDLPESRFMKATDVADAIWDVYNLSASTVVEEIILRPMQGDI